MGFLGGIAGSILSPIMGIVGSGGARSAAGAQQAGQQAAANLTTGMYNNALDFGALYRTAGNESLQNLQQYIAPGMPQYQAAPTMDPSQYNFQSQYQVPDVTQTWFNAAPYQESTQPYQFSGQQYNFDPNQYAFGAPTGQQVLQQDPGYQFRLQQGQQAMDQDAAAKGGLFSGGQLKAAQTFGQNMASQEYQNAYQRALGQNQMTYERALQANQQGYGRALGENQMGFQRAQDVNQFNYGIAQQQNADYWNRAMQAQQTAYGQQMGTQQFNYGINQAANQQDYLRGLQQYQTNQQARQQRYNELAGLTGMGAAQNQNAAQLTMGYAGQEAPWLAGVGSAQAGGIAGSTQAWLNALQNAQNSANSMAGIGGSGGLGGATSLLGLL